MAATYKDVRNSRGKLICKVDERHKAIQIVTKGVAAIITFNDDGTFTAKDAS